MSQNQGENNPNDGNFRGRGRGRGGHHGNRGGPSNRGNRGGANSHGNRDRKEGQNNRRSSQSGDNSNEFQNRREGQNNRRMGSRQNSAANINTANYGTDDNGGDNRNYRQTDYGAQGGNRGREQSGNRGRGQSERRGQGRGRGGNYQNMGGYSNHGDRDGQNEDRDERGNRDRNKRGRGGYSENRGGQRGRGGYNEDRESDARNYNEDRNRGHNEDRGRGHNEDRNRGHTEDRDRGNYEDRNRGHNEDGSRGRNNEDRARGNYDEGGSRGHYYDRGRGSNYEDDGGSRDGYNEDRGGNNQPRQKRGDRNDREAQKGNRGGRIEASRGGHSYSDDRGGNPPPDDGRNYPNSGGVYGTQGVGDFRTGYPMPPPPPPLMATPPYPPALVYPPYYGPPPVFPPPATNLIHHPFSGSTLALNQNPYYNNQNMDDRERPGNLSRSTSTPLVNNIGTRPKEKPPQSRHFENERSNMPSGQDYRNAPDENKDSSRRNRRTSYNQSFNRPESHNGVNVDEYPESNAGGSGRNRHDGRSKTRGNNQRGRSRDRGRPGYGRGYVPKQQHQASDGEQGQEGEDSNETEEENNKAHGKYSGLTRKERSKLYFEKINQRRRGRLNKRRSLWNTINRMVALSHRDEDTGSEGRSSFGSSLSLTSDVSEVMDTDKSLDNELKLDDLDNARLQTLRNRMKRYKLRLNNLSKEDGTDKDKIEELKKGIALLSSTIAARSKSEQKPESDNSGSKIGDQPKDVLKKENETTIIEDKEKIIILPRKMNFATSKKGKVSFKPKLPKSGGKKKVVKAISKRNDESSYSDSDVEVFDEDDEEVASSGEKADDIVEEIPDKTVKEKRERTPKKNKANQKESIPQSPDTVVINEDSMDDLMKKLDKPCNTKTAAEKKPARTPKNNNQESPTPLMDINVKPKNKKRPEMHQSGLNLAYTEDAPEFQKPTVTPDKNKLPDRTSETGAEATDEPNVNDVFKFLVKKLCGEADPEVIARESGLFPDGCDLQKWFIGFRKRFTLIERDGKITNVLAYNKEATYCLDYITKRSCDKPDCYRFHVCKDMLCGHCAFGDEQCRFSHDFLDENNRNLSISKRFGYNTAFKNEEIGYILMARYPHVCSYWNKNGECEKTNCSRLHICQRFILGNCLEDSAECALSHDKCSEHNKPIIDAYRMGQWDDRLFRRMVFIMRSPRQRSASNESSAVTDGAVGGDKDDTDVPVVEEECTETKDTHTINPVERRRINKVDIDNDAEEPALPVQQRVRKRKTPQEAKKSSTFISSATDDIGFICETSITSVGCSNSRCQLANLEERMPYIWQLHVFGQWISFHESEEIEKAFCDQQDGCSTELERDASIYHVHVLFNPNLHAFVGMAGHTDRQDILSVRRLSTRSYLDGKYKAESYKTQWRWYFKADGGRWEFFESNMQLTLEQKYLAGQKVYLYPRENFQFGYECDFQTMTQVNLETKKQRAVLRRPIFVPREYIDSGLYPKTLKPPSSLPPVPKDWYPWDICNQFEFVKLSTSSEAYKDVDTSFFQTMDRNRYTIDEILRVQNPALWRAFCSEEESMQAKLERAGHEDAVVSKRQLFHGTKGLETVRGIAAKNIDFRLSGINGKVYGAGAYFARDAKYSNLYTDTADVERFMFRASVMVGEYTLAKREYKCPPNKLGKTHEFYDSCVDNMTNPSIYVLFETNKYYPEYLIVYHDNQAPFDTPRPVPVAPEPIMTQRSDLSNPTVRISHPSSGTNQFSPGSYTSQGGIQYDQGGIQFGGQTYPSTPTSDPSPRSASPTQQKSPPAGSAKKLDFFCSVQ